MLGVLPEKKASLWEELTSVGIWNTSLLVADWLLYCDRAPAERRAPLVVRRVAITCGVTSQLTSILGLDGDDPLPLGTEALRRPGLDLELVRDVLSQVRDHQAGLCAVAAHLEGAPVTWGRQEVRRRSLTQQMDAFPQIFKSHTEVQTIISFNKPARHSWIQTSAIRQGGGSVMD